MPAISRSIGVGLHRPETGATVPPLALPQSPRTILVNGQSNAAGVPPSLGASWLQGFLGSDLHGWNDTTSDWSPLADDGANCPTAGGINGAGMIATPLLRRIAERSNDCYCIAGAYTSQGVAYFAEVSLTKAYYRDGTQHATLNNFNLMKARVQASNRDVEMVLWIQGEVDAGMSQAAYYAALSAIIEGYRAFCPKAHWIIVSTVGDATLDGVRAAQQQIATERYYVQYVDTTDMYSHTAWYGDDGAHYSIFAGQAEVTARIDARLLGLPDRPDVPAVDHIDDAIVWTNRFQYRHSVDLGQVVAWQNDLQAFSLQAAGALCFGHIANDPQLNNRPSCDIERSNSETMSALLTGETVDLSLANQWTIFAVGRLESIVQTQYLVELRITPGSSDRVAAVAVGQFDAFGILTAASSNFFPGGTTGVDTAASHSWCMVYDAVGLVARYYCDGVRIAEIAIAGTQHVTTPTLFVGSIAGTTGYLDAHLSLLSIASGHAANDAEVAAMHAYCEVEYGL